MFHKLILVMDIVLGGDESSSSKLSEAPTSILTSTTVVDEISNESTKLSLPIPDSESIPAEGTPKTGGKEGRMVKSSSTRVITADTTHMHIEPSHIIEYEWPPKSGERYFIQEQIAELLDVKSFKRKYPELSRHTIEINEREYLLANYKLATAINEHQMHGLTALRAIEIHELMASDYPAIYSEYQRAAADKVKLQMAEEQKRLDAIKLDTKKMDELRKSAIRSAFEFNSEMNAIKRTERRYFWDLQTSIIQSSKNRWKRMPPEYTRPGPYPAALIHGQYQHFYKKFTPKELRRLPLSTVLDYDYLLPPKRPVSPLPVIVHEEEVTSSTNTDSNDAGQHDNHLEIPPPVLLPSNYNDDMKTTLNKMDSQDLTKQQCSICGENEERQILSCSNCNNVVHPDCAGLPEHVVKVALNYRWNCIECKKCTICEKPDNEDAMMFCDRCDRGYHTFCVGLSTPPNGNWICSSFCSDYNVTATDDSTCNE
ncbi:phf10 protein, putative [Brugia malayi]|uniref:Phf10 protein, putative n=1 Tax=Brugia malayi TaxID=6279 RepID=A0A4E9FLE1_BRUMA|nr:phf10 protein, putative [Brugia malayi]VIO97765.1 phf10 protein, putative [Brugia malayi]